MARSARAATRGGSRVTEPEPSLSQTLLFECIGVALLGLAGLAVLALWTFHPADPLFSAGPVYNGAGVMGLFTGGILLSP